MDLWPILHILSDGAFHSGEKLGLTLGVSRTAVWKQIDRLRAMGVEVHSVTGKGYRLPVALSLLSVNAILEILGPESRQWESKLELRLSTPSTNGDALKGAQLGKRSLVCIAEHQSEGRGRRGRLWLSPLGCNIYLSMLVSIQSGMGALEGLSLAVAVMAANSLNDSGYSGFKLKWPNDIFLDGKKLGGILLEVTGDISGPCKVVIGVGLNIQLPKASKEQIEQPVIGLSEKFVGVPNRNKIVADLIRNLAAGVTLFEKKGFVAFKGQWEELDMYRGKLVSFGAGADIVEGVVQGVDGRGALLLRTGDVIKVMNGGEMFPSIRAV